MKYSLILFMCLFVGKTILGQAGGNFIYEENNRYKQNATYNEDSEKVWDFREDNKDYQKYNLPGDPSKEMVFSVNAIMNVKADSYLAIFNIVQTGKTAKETNEILNQKIEGFKKDVLAKGVGTSDIYTDMISLVPVYEYETEKKLFSTTYTEVPRGFEMQKNLHIRYTDEAILDAIITAAADNEIYDLIKVEYFVKENAKKYEDLRAQSILFMQKKLKDFEQIGIKLDTVYHLVSEKSSVAYPVDRYRSYQAFSGTSIEAMKSKQVTTVNKPKTMFYNKLPYHKYDIVINPEMLEPAVQFTYSIAVKYIIKDPVKKIEKHHILITPEGTIRTIDIK